MEITPLGSNAMVIRGPSVNAVGFVDDLGIVALSQSIQKRSVPFENPSYSVLRIVRVDSSTADASFSEDLKSAPTRRETWRFVEEGRKKDPHLPKSSGTDTPAFGEYVYVEELPEAMTKVAPEYPDWARKAGTAGTVVVQALVGKDGLVKGTKVVHSIPALDDYAVRAVKQWRFKPARAKGEPVEVWVAIPVRFSPD